MLLKLLFGVGRGFRSVTAVTAVACLLALLSPALFLGTTPHAEYIATEDASGCQPAFKKSSDGLGSSSTLAALLSAPPSGAALAFGSPALAGQVFAAEAASPTSVFAQSVLDRAPPSLL